EPLEHQRPRGGRLDGYLNLCQIRHHDIGASLTQGLGMSAPIDADDTAKPACPSSFDSGDGIFYDNGLRGFHTETPGTFQKGIRRRFALEPETGDVPTVHARVEELSNARGLEYGCAIIAGG